MTARLERSDIGRAFEFGARAMRAAIEAAGNGEQFDPTQRCWSIVRDVAAGDLTIAPNVAEYLATHPNALGDTQASEVIAAANIIVREDRHLAQRLLLEEQEHYRALGIPWEPSE